MPSTNTVSYLGKRKRIQETLQNEEMNPRQKKKAVRDIVHESKMKSKAHFGLLEKCQGMLQTWFQNKKKDQHAIKRIHKQLKKEVDAYGRLALSSNGSRLIQSVLKYASQDIVREIMQTVEKQLLFLSQDKFGYHVVISLCKSCKDRKLRDELYEIIAEKISKYLQGVYSSRVVEHMFVETKPSQRYKMFQEFYGAEAKFNVQKGSISEFVQAQEEVQQRVLERKLRLTLKKVLEKGLLDLNVNQYLMREYFNIGQPATIRAWTSDLIEQLVYIGHTKPGCEIAIKTICYTRAKERKQIMKEFKEWAVNASKDSFSFMIICVMMDVIDDTVAMDKQILSQLIDGDVLSNKFGASIFLHLLSAGSKIYFSQEQLSILNPSDLRTDLYDKEDKNFPIFKKPKQVKYEQLTKSLGERLVDCIDANQDALMKTQSGARLVLEICRNAHITSEKLSAIRGRAAEFLAKSPNCREFVGYLVQNEEFSTAFIQALQEQYSAAEEWTGFLYQGGASFVKTLLCLQHTREAALQLIKITQDYDLKQKGMSVLLKSVKQPQMLN